MLNKSIAAIVTFLLIATFQTAAIAGGCGHGGFGRIGFHAYQSSQSHSYALKQAQARKAAQARAVAAAKRKAAVQQARAEKKAETVKVAAVETPKVEETKQVAETDKTENELTVASADTTCRRFSAEIGTTVSVDCPK